MNWPATTNLVAALFAAGVCGFALARGRSGSAILCAAICALNIILLRLQVSP